MLSYASHVLLQDINEHVYHFILLSDVKQTNKQTNSSRYNVNVLLLIQKKAFVTNLLQPKVINKTWVMIVVIFTVTS